MADQLSATLKVTLTPPTGGISVNEAYTLATEAHTKSLKRTIILDPGITDFPVEISDIPKTAFLMLSTNNPVAIKYNDTANTPRMCRKVLIDTPNRELISVLYLTTTTLPVTMDLFVVGD